jgi:hypothetical protein
MAFTINGTTGINLGTQPLTGSLPDANAPVGSVLQVVSTAKTNTFSTSSLTFSDITDLSVSVTPNSASSKILIIVGLSLGGTENAFGAHPRLMRDSTAIFVSDSAGNRTQSTMQYELAGAASIPASIVFLDSPSTTSLTTYKIQIATVVNATETWYVNRYSGNTNYGSTSTITLMEVAG